MRSQHAKKRAIIPVLGNVVLLLLGVTISLGAVEMLMRAFPSWIPSEVRVNPPTRRVRAFIDETYDLKQSNGDLYHLMRGNIVPLSPDQDQVVARVHMITDINGFRNSPPDKATYEIVALGDSFTRASGVASAWPQELAENIGSDVLSLADVAFGPQDELKVLRQYGLKKHPKLVVLAYFEGNDLYDAAAYEQANPFILPRFARYILGQGLDAWQTRKSDGAPAVAAPSYLYPITVTINNKALEMSFFSSYISWLSLSREEIEVSQNYRLTREIILEMRDASESENADFLLVYLPSKAHVYLPYVKDAAILERVFTDIPMIGLDDAGFLQFINKRTTLELTRQHIDDQSQLLAALAAEQDINFLDLTPYFQQEAGTGAELYYPFDTHWNQQGHDLAARTIAMYVKENFSLTASTKPRDDQR